MEFEGIVFSLLPMAKGTGQRGEWMKQDVVFDVPGEFKRKVCVSFWGDKARDASELKQGETVSVSANVESREYNGRWYTEARAWRMVRKTPAAGLPNDDMLPPLDAFVPEPPSDEVDDLPF